MDIYKQIHLGFFDKDKFDDAVKARKKAEKKYFGEYNINYKDGENIEN